MSFKVAQVGGFVRDPSFWGQVSRRSQLQSGKYWKGSFVVRLSYDAMTELFRGVFGGYTNQLVETGVRDHVFIDPANATIFPPSYTFEYAVGGVPNYKVFRVTGAKILGVTIKGQVGTGNTNIVTAEFNIWATGFDTNAGAGYTAASNAMPTYTPIYAHNCIVATDGTADSALAGTSRVTGFEVSYMPPWDEERFYLTSSTPDEPVRTDFLAPSWKLTQEFLTTSAMEKYRNLTTGSVKLVFQNPGTPLTTHTFTSVNPQAGTTITRASGSFLADMTGVTNSITPGLYLNPATGNGISQGNWVVGTTVALTVNTLLANSAQTGVNVTATGNKELEIRSGTCYQVEDPTPPVEGFGKLSMTTSWEASYDSGDSSSMLVRMRNAEAALA
jgi:hypothetical protein